MLICDHAHTCTRECAHAKLHQPTDVFSWVGCTWEHPRHCVDEFHGRMVAFISEVVATGHLEDLKALIKKATKLRSGGNAGLSPLSSAKKADPKTRRATLKQEGI